MCTDDKRVPNPDDSPRRRILVVGAGLAGTATAIRLLRFATEPVEVVLVDREPAHRHAGPAYHPDGNPWHHVFNIQAGRMSVFREDVDDFLSWCNHEADRSAWPPHWRAFAFTESGPAPRRVFADYLAQRLAEAAADARAGVVLREADADVVDLVPGATGTTAVFERFCWLGGEPAPGVVTLEVDRVVLATGPESRHPGYADAVLDHSAYVRHPYSRDAVDRINAVRPDATVVVIGSLLSAYDMAAMLLRRGHRGAIHLISRSRLTPKPYPADHKHRVVHVPAPVIDPSRGGADLLRQWAVQWNRACRFVALKYPDEHPSVISERVAKAWEEHLPAIVQRLSDADLRAVLDRYGSLIATLRVSAMAYTTEIVDSARVGTGQVRLDKGRVVDLRAADGGRLTVKTSDGQAGQAGQEVLADLVIANFARLSDYAHTGSTLWRRLLDAGLATPHRRTQRGVEITEGGALRTAAGPPVGSIFVVGAPREGDEIVRFGRTGAFGFNLAAIKNHSIGVAAGVLRELETRYASDPAPTEQLLPEPLRRRWSTLVDLEVRRLAARGLQGRDELLARFEAELADATGVPGDRRWVARLNEAAVERLTDVSVTPRELRSSLALDADAGAVPARG
ncbi:FAD/NAD(P)-binding protein [Actinokineospora diospyrosa]|uniref:NAD(P)/FAD-binding protein YdhS n=1 Tax=Actinokineospora diospyrosa TaxID=103728 RepID=A0ABT1IBP6_9PSEU|nr:FAD/NAD(P)-binding protein [Actinokineospora diospyrosa]MCP2270058.1 putative NAD(P)/FAD-binding protein YdhS [Actinokineospora diospyrosa]